MAAAGEGGVDTTIGGPWIITIGTSGNLVGYDFATFGDMQPSIPQVIAGAFITLAWSQNGFDFVIEVSGARLQDFFTSVTVDDADGNPVLFETSDLQGGQFIGTSPSSWLWGDGTNRLWEVADSGELKNISMVI